MKSIIFEYNSNITTIHMDEYPAFIVNISLNADVDTTVKNPIALPNENLYIGACNWNSLEVSNYELYCVLLLGDFLQYDISDIILTHEHRVQQLKNDKSIDHIRQYIIEEMFKYERLILNDTYNNCVCIKIDSPNLYDIQYTDEKGYNHVNMDLLEDHTSDSSVILFKNKNDLAPNLNLFVIYTLNTPTNLENKIYVPNYLVKFINIY